MCPIVAFKTFIWLFCRCIVSCLFCSNLICSFISVASLASIILNSVLLMDFMTFIKSRFSFSVWYKVFKRSIVILISRCLFQLLESHFDRLAVLFREVSCITFRFARNNFLIAGISHL